MAASLGLSGMTLAVQALYGIVSPINDFLDKHIEALRRSSNPTIASTGRVLEGAKFGFGLGYMSSVAIIAAGQLLLGNSLISALGTVMSAATLSNPIAMTCAAVGAIYYGWAALTDKERSAILDRLSEGLEMGIELIRSLIDFTIRKMQEFLSSKQLQEFKDFVKSQAALFGKSLYDITGQVADLVKGTVEKAGELTGQAVGATSSAAMSAINAAGGAASRTADAASTAAKGVAGMTGDVATRVAGAAYSTAKRIFRADNGAYFVAISEQEFVKISENSAAGVELIDMPEVATRAQPRQKP
jgi:hypothetical protein